VLIKPLLCRRVALEKIIVREKATSPSRAIVKTYMGKFSENIAEEVSLAMLNPKFVSRHLGRTFWVLKTAATNYTQFKEDHPDYDGVSKSGVVTNASVYNTVDAAVGACTANQGDTIYVMPGHTEDISGTTSLVVDIAGVSIIGLGIGDERPTLSFTATDSRVELDADCRISNMIWNASISAVVVGFNFDANGIEFDHNELNWVDTGDDFVTMLDIDAFDNINIHHNDFIAEDTGGCDEAIRMDDANNVKIEHNYFYGDFTDGVIIGEDTLGVNLLINDNVMYNSDTTAGHLIDLNVASKGIISYNKCGTLFTTAPETAFDPGECLCIENYVCNNIDESGALVPVAVST